MVNIKGAAKLPKVALTSRPNLRFKHENMNRTCYLKLPPGERRIRVVRAKFFDSCERANENFV